MPVLSPGTEPLSRKGTERRTGDPPRSGQGRSTSIAGERYGTEWQWEQPHAGAHEIYHLRRAVSHQKFAQIPDVTKCMYLNNLGNRLEVSGSGSVEALDCWRRTLEAWPTFGMALCNRAGTLAAYAESLEDTDGARPSSSYMGGAHRRRRPHLRRQRSTRTFVMNAIREEPKRSRSGSNPC